MAPFRPRSDQSPWVTFDKYISLSAFIHEDQLKTGPRKVPNDRILIPGQTNAGFDLFLIWDDAMEMTLHYTLRESANNAAFAYAWIDLSGEGLASPNDETFDVLTNRSVSPGGSIERQSLIGYDLTSTYFISALSGYDHTSTSRRLVDSTRPKMNDLGLLRADLSPLELARTTEAFNIEINEDPFFVVGIFLLWDHSGRLSD